MPRLAPPPAGVLELHFRYERRGLHSSVGQWIAVPGLELANLADVELVLSGLLAYWLPFSVRVTDELTSLVRVDFASYSGTLVRGSVAVGLNTGGRPRGDVAAAATILHWANASAGRGGRAVSYMPGFPGDASDDGATVTLAHRGRAHDAAVTWLNGVASTPGVSGGSCLHGSLQRVDARAPLPAARFVPTTGVVASWRVGRIDRRRPVAR